jgi:putative membrane protein
MDAADVQIPFLRSMNGAKAIGAILALSAAVFAFLVWLIYFKPAAGYSSEVIGFLPALNAILNGCASAFLVAGFVAVRRRRYAAHIKLMFGALICSTLFLISYVVYHNFHGDTKFLGTGIVRPIYFFILISHIILSAVVVPLILTTLYLALAGKLATHRRVSRYTFPVWLYVSVTGVLIFAMLKLFQPAAA